MIYIRGWSTFLMQQGKHQLSSKKWKSKNQLRLCSNLSYKVPKWHEYFLQVIQYPYNEEKENRSTKNSLLLEERGLLYSVMHKGIWTSQIFILPPKSHNLQSFLRSVLSKCITLITEESSSKRLKYYSFPADLSS